MSTEGAVNEVRERVWGDAVRGSDMATETRADGASKATGINPLPPHRLGLQRVRAYPYFLKERWPEADFGDRWRAIKAHARTHQPESAARGAATGAGD